MVFIGLRNHYKDEFGQEICPRERKISQQRSKQKNSLLKAPIHNLFNSSTILRMEKTPSVLFHSLVQVVERFAVYSSSFFDALFSAVTHISPSSVADVPDAVGIAIALDSSSCQHTLQLLIPQSSSSFEKLLVTEPIDKESPVVTV
jgi:hypothetical protein